MKDELEIKEIEIIKELFGEERKINGYAPEEMIELDEEYSTGGDIFITENGELITLEYQEKDFDEVELVKYIELAEELYNKNKVFITIYVVCPKTINVTVPECSIKSDAEFKIKLASLKPNPAYEELYRIKEKVNKKMKLNDEDIETLSMIPMMGQEEDKRNLRIECLRVLKKYKMC